jgi:hypothetical protein
MLHETRKILYWKNTGRYYYNSIHCNHQITKIQPNPKECILTQTNFCCIKYTKELAEIFYRSLRCKTGADSRLHINIYKPNHDRNPSVFMCFTFRILRCVCILRSSALSVTSCSADVKLCRY